MNVALISTYELGRQPFGLASPAAWLARHGASVRCLDLAVERLDESAISGADLVGLFVPMHTAARLAIGLIERVRRLNPSCHLCCYGLYAPPNEELLRRLGVDSVLGGEFETPLIGLAEKISRGGTDADKGRNRNSVTSLGRQRFVTPLRAGLPDLSRYARLQQGSGEGKIVGYTEATRGCKHRCRHCPVVPVYGGTFRVVGRDVVLADIRQQVEAGAQHITFGDPDFLNGPTYAMDICRAIHEDFPELTYDVTTKVEHILRHSDLLPALRSTGCLLVTTAVECLNPDVLRILEKGHGPEEFYEAVRLARDADLFLSPTFIPFMPWTSGGDFFEILAAVARLGLIEEVSPIQYSIRLLIPRGSRLLELEDVAAFVGQFDETQLCYPWRHPDPRMDHLQERVAAIVEEDSQRDLPRRSVFIDIWRAACDELGEEIEIDIERSLQDNAPLAVEVPYLTEPWYC